MIDKDLVEIKNYWSNKYPHVSIVFSPMSEEGKYFGMIFHGDTSTDLQSDTIGGIIGQGEAFLRTLSRDYKN